MSAAATTYKKKNGSLAVDESASNLLWTPSEPPDASPTVTIAVKDITNLQQTPVSTPKAALKVVVQPPGASAPESHVFYFVSATAARADQEAITDILRKAIASLKTPQSAPSASTPTPATASTPIPNRNAGGQPAAMAIAQAVSAGVAKTTDGWYDDARLKSDIELQRSLLDANPILRQRFNESLRDKPETISITQFSTQFWSTRLHLLRAHAIEKAQSQGDYNVLPEIKFKRIVAEKEGEPDKLMLNLAKEQVKLIFKQYPIVREAYNDNVPQIDQNTFWSRFFMSRLLKKLKGEKITDADPPDAIFDRYLGYREKGPTLPGYVPNFIDLEGNEQNHSQRKGNRPDETMRPGSFDKVPILRVLNNLSEKMMAHVAPADGDLHRPIGMDEETYNELQLRDLQAEAGDNRVTLNIKDQQRLLAGEQGNKASAEASLYARKSPDQVLASLITEIRPDKPGNFGLGSLSLDQAIGVQSDDDESDDEANGQSNGMVGKQQTIKIGSKRALTDASRDILSSISAHRSAAATDPSSTLDLSHSTFDTVTMTHNTTVEFLHYFWTLFLSGDGSRSNELVKLVETLDKSVDRLNAVSAMAENEKIKKSDALKKQMRTLNEKSNKRRKLEYDLSSIVPTSKLQKNSAYFSRYQVKYKRRRSGKTDYYARKRLITQAKNKYNAPKYRLVVRFTNRDIICQIVTSEITGDKVFSAAYAHELKAYGITHGLTNWAAAYATGLLLARRTLKKLNLDEAFTGVEEADGEFQLTEEAEVDGETRRPFKAFLDVGLTRTSTGARVFGAMKGASDGGLYIPHSEKRFPGYDIESKELDAETLRKYIFAGHVAEYMETLADDDEERYKSQFQGYIDEEIEADGLEELYQEAHKEIREDPFKKTESEGPKKTREEWKAESKKYRQAKLTKAERDERVQKKIQALSA